MGLLDGVLGNAAEIEAGKVQEQFAQILLAGERVEKAYQFIRDMFVFTDRRLVFVDYQGISGKKVEYHSIPYPSISHFSVETAGSFDLNAELKVWVIGQPVPFKVQFNTKLSVYTVQAVLAGYVLREPR
jgi:hypothetical protein